MKTKKLVLNNIPVIIWGQESQKVYIYVHGKMSCKEYAQDFAQIAEEKGYQTISFDLPEHGERTDHRYRCDIWNGIKDLTTIADYTFARWSEVSLFACSLGAYFSLHTFMDRKFTNCLFQSPILNMEYLIKQMFEWYNVSEERLRLEKEIVTPFDTLRWDYYQYVLAHPLKIWDIPTVILYGGKDNLQSIEVIQAFADVHHCTVTVAKESDHPFMQPEDIGIVAEWVSSNI